MGLLVVACGLAVLATVTPNTTWFSVAGLAALGGWQGMRWGVLSVFSHRWGAELGEHLFASWLAFVLSMLAITMSFCLVLLYKGHPPSRVLGLTGLFLLIVMVVVVVWTGGLFWLGPGHPSPPSVQLHPPSQPLSISMPEGALRVEPEVGYRPKHTYYRLLHTQVRLDGVDGASWNLAQAHDANSNGGPTLGFYPALEEALAEIPAAQELSGLETFASPRTPHPQLRLLAKDTVPLGLPTQEMRAQGRTLLEERQLRWLGAISAKSSSRIQERGFWAQIATLPSSPPPSELQLVVQSLHSGNKRCRLIFLPLAPGGKPAGQIGVGPRLTPNGSHRLPLPIPYPIIIRESLSLPSPSSPPGKDLRIGALESCAVARRLARLADQTYWLIHEPR